VVNFACNLDLRTQTDHIRLILKLALGDNLSCVELAHSLGLNFEHRPKTTLRDLIHKLEVIQREPHILDLVALLDPGVEVVRNFTLYELVGDAHENSVWLACVCSSSAVLLLEQPAFAEDVGLAHHAQVVARGFLEVDLAFHDQEEVQGLVALLEDHVIRAVLAQFGVECDRLELRVFECLEDVSVLQDCK